MGLGPGSPPCSLFTAEVDGITYTDPNNNDTDGDGLNDSYEALVLLTDPTAADTDGDGISDGIEVNGSYGNPPKPLIQGITIRMATNSMMEKRILISMESLMETKPTLLE